MAIEFIKNPDERNDPPRPLLEHLLALRDMLIFGASSWLISAIVAGCCSPWIMAWLKSPAGEDERLLQGLDLTSGVSAIISIAGWGGTALAFPFIVYAILRFVFPALTRREKFVILSIMVVGTAFFLGGVILAFKQTLPLVVSVFQSIYEWVFGTKLEVIRIENYISIVLKTIVAFGLVFQLPLIIFVLGWFGIVSSAVLREKRRIAIVLSFFLAMFLTPPDPMSQVFMAIPLVILYEISIWAVWLKEKGTFGK